MGEVKLEEFVKNYPDLILELSGPWPAGINEVDQRPKWIVNFKQISLCYNYIHSGSSGNTVDEAFANGMAYLKENYERHLNEFN